MKKSLLSLLVIVGLLFFFPSFSSAEEENLVSLYIAPSAGTFTLGGTFNVSFYINTAGKSINAIDAKILFPPDKIQVVSPSTGQSVIQLWTKQPTYSNVSGTIIFQGAIPAPGLNTSSGLISTVTFRVKEMGEAIIKFSDESRVLLNDGKGTNVLGRTSSGIYSFVLPPPAGPIVSSPSHPDQSKWYSGANIVLVWSREDATVQFSYILDDTPLTILDDISEGNQTGVIYKNAGDGLRYFHIKAKRGLLWGGTTHYGLEIDTTPPAKFPLEISPSSRTTRRLPIISFSTTDVTSGIDHYEIKIIPLSASGASLAAGKTPFFVEAVSPYIPELGLGDYDVVARAYDRAGNFTEAKTRLKIVTAIFEFVSGEGLRIKGGITTIPWLGLWLTIASFSLLTGFFVWKARRWHKAKDQILSKGALSDPVIKERLKQLKDKQKEYTKALMIVLLLGSLFLLGRTVLAEEKVSLAPPIVTDFSENVSNQELFYIGGKTEIPSGQIVIYLQNLQTGETFSQQAIADKMGNWFYSHPKFLTSGKYMLWVQAKIGEELSPPSPQLKLTVQPTAIQFGVSRLSYEVIYLAVSIILFIAVAVLIGLMIYHSYHGRKKRKGLQKEIKEAEEAIRRGFGILKKDIEAQLAVVRKMQLEGQSISEVSQKEEKLLKDLEWVKQYIGKEVLDIDYLEQKE